MINTEVYNKGLPRFGSERFKTYAEIHDMADKPGFVGKEIIFDGESKSAPEFNFEKIKGTVGSASGIMDEYIKSYLPKYFYTFRESAQDAAPALYYFMEEVKPARSLPPVEWMDAFLYRCCKMYMGTKEQYGGFGVDLNKIENLEFGTTITNPKPRLYLIDLYPSYFNLPAGRLMEQISHMTRAYGGPDGFPRVSSIINQIK